MIKSLKTKLVLTISLLVVILFTISSILFVNEKSKDFISDIFKKTKSYAELTANTIVGDYQTYLEQNSFVYFNRSISDLKSKFEDLSSFKIVSYSGEIVYDSIKDTNKKYDGDKRSITDVEMLKQIQSRNGSVKTLKTNRFVYLKNLEDGNYDFVDFVENRINPLKNDERIEYYVQPANNQYAVIYYINYDHLSERVAATAGNAVLMAIFGVLIGVFLAYLYAASITKPIKNLTIGAAEIAKGDFKKRVSVPTKDEMFQLAEAFNSMAHDLEISTKALVYKERVAKELELAAKIQKEILPKVIPSIDGLDISAGLLPAEEIGGDCYDFIKSDESSLLMYLGDVTGHGVPAGIVVSIANALIYNFSKSPDIKDILINVNKILKEKTTASMFMTLVMLRWSVEKKLMEFVSAGHEQIIHYHSATDSVSLLPAGGLALGMMKDIGNSLKKYEIDMDVNDVLIVYSDGIPECWCNEKEMFGMDRFKNAVQSYSKLPSALSIRNALLTEVKQFEGNYKQMDDITLMVIKRTGYFK